MKKLLVIIVLLIIVMVVSCQAIMNNALNSVDNSPIVNVADVKDGSYNGKAETPLVNVEVNVSVKDKRIVDIVLLRHDSGKGKNAESMIAEMIKQNTSEVEIVSGATTSSKVIRAAVRDALFKGI